LGGRIGGGRAGKGLAAPANSPTGLREEENADPPNGQISFEVQSAAARRNHATLFLACRTQEEG
jgi:hypothetical protein